MRRLVFMGMCAAGCSGEPRTAPSDAGPEAAASLDAARSVSTPTPRPRVDGGYADVDAGVLPESRFVTRVVSFEPGECAGFGIPFMPDVVLGPPFGGGAVAGSTDVLSLGSGGRIVVSFEPGAIADGPGPDFIVFENAFHAGGDPARVFAEPGEVSVSDDGVAWKTFPCTAKAPPFGACAGWRPVYSAPNNGISAVDPQAAGGDAFDLADVGLARARFVRVVDRGASVCPPPPDRPNTHGFDLDAIAIVNAAK